MAAAWFRRLGWSNSRQSWMERGAFAAWLVLAGTATYFARGWTLGGRVIAIAGMLLLLALLLRRGWLKLLGPVFFHELRRGARRRVHLHRTLFTLSLFLGLFYVWGIRGEIGEGEADTARHQASVGTAFFLVFFVVQLAIVMFVTPAAVAGAIAEEKERKTIDLLLATDLRGREIVFGKLAGRMTNLLLLLIAGLPVLSVIQLLGGIEPALLLAAYAVVFLTLAGLCGLSMFVSVGAKRVRSAVAMTFLCYVIYLVISAVFPAFRLTLAATWSVSLGGMSIDYDDVERAFCGGNLFVAAVKIMSALDSGTAVADVLWPIFQWYAAFHLVVFVLGSGWAAFRMRSLALDQSGGAPRRRRYRTPIRRPSIGNYPIIWKEIFADSTKRLPWLARIIAGLIVLGSFLPPVIIIYQFWDELSIQPPFARGRSTWNNPWFNFQFAISMWFRTFFVIVGCISLMAVAVRAAGAINGEREKRTLNELLTTPLSAFEIVLGKWLGSLFAVRPLLLLFGLVAFAALCMGGLHPAGVVLALISWLIFASFFAALGIWFSIHDHSQLRSIVITLLLTLFFGGGHWIVMGLLVYWPLNVFYPQNDVTDWLVSIEMGFTPPVVLAVAPYAGVEELERFSNEDWRPVWIGAIDLVVWSVAAAALMIGSCVRFAFIANRMDRRPRPAPDTQAG